MNAQRICLALLFLTQALYGIGRAVSDKPEALFLTSTLASMALIFFWCKFDAEARHASLPLWNRILIIAIALIGVPVYFFRTLPRRRAALATLKAAGLVVALGIVSGASSVIAHWIAT